MVLRGDDGGAMVLSGGKIVGVVEQIVDVFVGFYERVRFPLLSSGAPPARIVFTGRCRWRR